MKVSNMEDNRALLDSILNEINDIKLEILEKSDKLDQLKDILDMINNNVIENNK